MSTTTEQHNPTRPPFPFGARVYWPIATYPTNVAIGELVDPATPDVGPIPEGTVPVRSHGVMCYVAPNRLRRLPAPAAPTV